MNTPRWFSLMKRVAGILAVAGLILVMPIPWKSASRLPAPLLDCPAQAAASNSSASSSSALTQARCGLGSRWEVNEGCWRGVYIRRGNSNVFDAEWTLLDGRSFRAEVTINIQGARVFGQRRRATQPPYGDCDLVNGALEADGVTVTGVWECNNPEGRAQGCFFARIICDDSTSSAGPSYPNLQGSWESKFRPDSQWMATSITQEGNSLIFYNERGGRSRGRFISPNEVVADEWENGLRARITDGGNRLEWVNGSVWRRRQ